MILEVRHFFDASHQLPDSADLITKACNRLHGHTYAVRVAVEGEPTKHGMVVDFKAIKNIIDELDHRHLNDILKNEPTAENIAIYIFKALDEELEDVSIISVAICEGYKGEDRASWSVYEP